MGRRRGSIIGGSRVECRGLPGRLTRLAKSHLFPVSLDELKGKKEIFSLTGGEIIRFGSPGRRPKIEKARAASGPDGEELVVNTCKSAAHPLNGVMLYRVHYQNKSFVYATDIEQQEGGYPEVIEFARGADLLIHDAQYLPEEYFSRAKARKGWGHSPVDMAVDVARKAEVKRLVLFHHEPTHYHKTMKKIPKQATAPFHFNVVARERMENYLV